jgi:hypothetical protein
VEVVSKEKFKVLAKRSEGWWALTFPGRQGWFSQGKDEAEVEFMAKDLINLETGIPTSEIELEIEYQNSAVVNLQN